jgi:hypothetical protein
MRRKAGILNDFERLTGKFHITEDWVVKNVLGFTDEEIKENDKLIIDELKKSRWLDAIKNGEIKYDEAGKEMISDYSELLPKKPEDEENNFDTSQDQEDQGDNLIEI